MRVGIAADHGGFALKQELAARLRTVGHEVVDFGALRLDPNDDYPDLVALLARAIAAAQVERGVAICRSGVGACVCASKIAGACCVDPGSFFGAVWMFKSVTMGDELRRFLIKIKVQDTFPGARRRVGAYATGRLPPFAVALCLGSSVGDSDNRRGRICSALLEEIARPVSFDSSQCPTQSIAENDGNCRHWHREIGSAQTL